MCIIFKAQGSRLRWLDSLRGLAIILVLIGHIHSFPFQKFIYGFHMPLFFVLSGYLFRNGRTFPELLHNIARRYIFPYFVLCGINLLIETVIHWLKREYYDIPHFMLGILYSRGTVEYMPNCSPLWFLTALSSALVIYFWITRIPSRILSLSAVISCSLISLALDKYGCPKLFWNIDTALMGVLFLEVGRTIRESDLTGRFGRLNTTAKEWAILITLFLGASAIHLNYRDVSFDNNRYGSYILMVIGAVSVCSALFCLAHETSSLSLGFLQYLGRHTLFIMSFDYFSNRAANFFKPDLWIIILILKLAVILTGLSIWNFLISRIHNERVRTLLEF
ncbi:MAG: acyltransferase family protein [Synergistaceae bacterium]|nr:acyltransferase family protein [Synergistaceae bacterium]